MPKKRLPVWSLPQLPAKRLEAAQQAAASYARGSRSKATWRAYESDWAIFNRWCGSVEKAPLPAEPATVALFMASEAKLGRAPATLGRRLAAIRLMHVGARLPSPHDALEVQEVLRGIRRAWRKPKVQKAPAVDADLKRLVDAVEPQTLMGLRDRALLLLGFAGAFRRSELVALDVESLRAVPEGLAVFIAHSKTDQEGEGAVIAIPRIADSPYCPVQGLDDWCVAANITSGALFRRLHRGDTVGVTRLTDQSVALIIKGLALKVDLDPTRYAGHSLRSGFLTSAARNRASIFKMADQSRHKSLDVLREYVRNEERFEDHAGAQLLRARPGSRRS